MSTRVIAVVVCTLLASGGCSGVSARPQPPSEQPKAQPPPVADPTLRLSYEVRVTVDKIHMLAAHIVHGPRWLCMSEEEAARELERMKYQFRALAGIPYSQWRREWQDRREAGRK